MRLIYIFLLGIFVFPSALKAQSPNHLVAGFKGIYGKPIIYSDSLSTGLTTPFQAFQARLGVQTHGKSVFDGFYGFPEYGLGIFHANLHQPDTLGNPWAAYGYFKAPIFRTKNFNFYYDFSIGMAWNFKKFDPITNNQNDLIGSALTAYFGLAFGVRYQINPRWAMDAGLDLIHFSNGKMQTPNKGMNLRSGHLAVDYGFNFPSAKPFDPAPFHKTKAAPFDKYFVLDLGYAFGGKSTSENYGVGPIYLAWAAMLDVQRRYQKFGQYGLGLDYLFDSSIKQDYASEPSISKLMFLGIHASHELSYERVNFVTHLGTYLWKGTEAKGNFYFRVGMKVLIYQNWYMSLSLKTNNGFIADYIEWGLGKKFEFKE